ncbi:molybdopterin cofactor-binding domain-containing protein, partial [Streptomyces sp. NPDC006386]|uniref:molybdopterin cofactor-binding domain-containing protein n=1 Tax=Streptomyces sp. NPDC006386 TaxID=3156762 RepID=UPI0033BCA586
MTGSVGAPAERREGREKVGGTARYAAEYHVPGRAQAWPVPAAVARGRVTGVDTAAALAVPGVLAVLTHENAPRLAEPDDATLAVLQDPRVPHRGWFVALVVAETLEAARAGAATVRLDYDAEEHDVVLTASHPDLYVPEEASAGEPGLREHGDPDGAFGSSAARVDVAYRVPPLHNHPMEPHASTARWEDGRLTVHTSSQGTNAVRAALAGLFGLPEERIV